MSACVSTCGTAARLVEGQAGVRAFPGVPAPKRYLGLRLPGLLGTLPLPVTTLTEAVLRGDFHSHHLKFCGKCFLRNGE